MMDSYTAPPYVGRQRNRLLQDIWQIYYAENEFIVQCSCLLYFIHPFLRKELRQESHGYD